MTLVDRSVCRREGHKPAFTLMQTSGVTINEYITQCVRCGKMIAVAVDVAKPAVYRHGPTA